MGTDKPKIGVGVGVMILKEGRVLLGKRHEDPEKAKSALNGAGTWTMPGGKVKFGESFSDAGCRELEEETGIKFDKLDVIALNEDQVEGVHFVTIGLLGEVINMEPEVKEPDTITEWKWFNINELPEPMFFPSSKILDNYRQKKFYLESSDKNLY